MTMTVRWGILGTARIAPMAIIRPSRKVVEANVVAVASREGCRAQRFAKKHAIPRHHSTYENLLADDGVDAVYVSLPNSLHCKWTIRALEAGKHVLCEKPLSSNADEAERMVEVAERTGLVLAEGFHYRHHPFAATLQEVFASGVLGNIRHIDASMCFPIFKRSDIRYSFELGGGALMDLGCYAVNLIRFITGAEPEVTQAEVRLVSDNIDRWTRAELMFADGATARLTCSMLTPRLLNFGCRVDGEKGKVIIHNPYMPHLFNILRIDTKSRKQRGMQPRGESTYYYQLKAVSEAIQGKPLHVGTAQDAVKNMRVIDEIYLQAGLSARGLTGSPNDGNHPGCLEHSRCGEMPP
jgi:predicted dehydrogenase